MAKRPTCVNMAALGQKSKKTARSILIDTEFKNLSILPANMNLAGVEIELAELEDRNRVMKKAIATLVVEYD